MSNVSNSYGAGTTTLGSIGNWWSQATSTTSSQNGSGTPASSASASTPAATVNLSPVIPVGPPTLGSNIVQNGNFEANAYSSGTTLTGSDLNNWQITGQVAIKGIGYQGALSQELDLTGMSNGSTKGVISQTLNTVAGQTYRVSFDVFTGAGTELDSTATVNVGFGGNSVATGLQGGNVTDLNNGRVRYTYDVVATGASTDLSFSTSGDIGTSAQIDNVAVAAVIPASTPTPPAPPTPAPSNPPVDVSAFQPLASRTLDSLTLNGGTFTFQSPNEIVYVTGDVNINAATKFGGTGTIVSRGNINVNGDVQYADASSSLNVVGQQTTTFGSGATQVVGNFFDHNAAGTGTIVFNGPVQDTSGSFHADKFVYNGNANPTNVTSQTPAAPSLSSNLPAPNGGNGSQAAGGNASASNGQVNYSLYEQPQGANAPKVIKPAQNGPMYLDPRGDFMKMFNEEVIQPLGQIIQSQANSKGRNGSSTTNAPSAYASFALSDSAKLAFSTADALTGMAQIKNGQVGAYVAPEPQAAPIFAPSATPKDNSDETKTDALPATTLAPPTSVAAQPVVQVAQVAASLVALRK